MARELVMAATRIVRGIGSSCYRGLPVLEKGSETDTPPVILVLMPTHTQTPLHTTHIGTGTANRYQSNGEVHVTTQHDMQCAKRTPATCPVDSCNTLVRKGEGVGVKPNGLKPGRVPA